MVASPIVFSSQRWSGSIGAKREERAKMPFQERVPIQSGGARKRLCRDVWRFVSWRAYFPALLATCAALASGAAQADRPLSIDDILAMEDIGRAIIARQGRAIIYERIPPYQGAPNLDVLSSPVDRSVLARIEVYDLERQHGPQPLFEQEVDSGYWIGSLSPDGMRVAVYSLKQGTLRAGVFDLALNRVTWFGFVPNYDENLIQTPIWISNDQLVFATLSENQQPSIIDRAGLIARLNQRWRKTFLGSEPSVTVIRSTPGGVHDADQFRPGNLLRVDASSGRTQALGEGYFYNLRLSPDRRFLAALKEAGRVQAQYEQLPGGLEATRRQVVVFDLQSGGLVTPCTDCHVLLGSLSWSTRGNRLMFLARPVGRGPEAAQLYEYAPRAAGATPWDVGQFRFACGEVRAALVSVANISGHVVAYGHRETLAKTESPLLSAECGGRPRSDWHLLKRNGESVNLTAHLARVSGDLLAISDKALYVLADDGAWRIEPHQKGQRTRIVPGALTAWSSGLARALRSREDMFTGSSPHLKQVVLESELQVVVLDVEAGRYQSLDKPSTKAQLLAWSNPGVTLFREDGPSGSRITVSDGKGRTRTVLEINKHLASTAPPRRHYLKYVGSNGEALRSCMLLPSNWREGVRYPVIVHAYPSANGACRLSDDGKFSPYTLQLLAARGYIVLFPAMPRKGIRTSDGPTRGATALALAAVGEAVREGYADPGRIGVLGFSQGNHLALQIAAQSDKFKAVVAMFGLANPSSAYGATPLRTRIADLGGIGDARRFESPGSDNWIGAKPWEDPERYVENSVVFSENRVRSPVLLIHSDLDVFPLGQSEEMFARLYRERATAEYVTYWGEGHGPLSPANIRDMWQRIFTWFDKHLATEPSSIASTAP